MSKHANQRTSVSALLGTTIVDQGGKPIGLIREVAIAPASDAAHVYGMVLRPASSKRNSRSELVQIADLQFNHSGQMQLRKNASTIALDNDQDYLLLERDLLDQQIIDIHGHKVVRVNDVELVWESSHETADDLILRICEVEVGLRGAVRRLLKGLPHRSVHKVASRFGPSVIPWEFVDLIERDPARRVRLKIEQDRLSEMHPSDIAEILEELAPAERQALFVSLDEEVAAEALEEVDPKLQRALIEDLDSEQVAGIVEEMDPGAAADLLSELSDERSEAILDEMDPDGRQEVEELLEFSGDSAAGRMTTEYIALPATARVSEAIEALRTYEGDTAILTDIYLVDEEERLTGVVPLVHLLLAPAETPLTELPDSHIVTCNTEANGKKVAELFDKYNLRSLPVLDEEKKLVGAIHAEQVIALLRENH